MFYYAHRALYKLGFYNQINIQSSIIINGTKFTIPIIKGTGYHNLLMSEKWFELLLQKLLPQCEGSFVDIGMNIGQTLLKLKAVDAQRSYIGFEPNPLCAYYCGKLIEANQFTGCTVYPCGLFNADEMLTLYMDTDYASGASVLQNIRKNVSRYKKQIKVPVFMGDEIFLKEQQQIGFLKADVEGAELEVIQGLKKTIEKDMPLVMLEILPVYNAADENGTYRKSRQDALLTLMNEIGYSLFLINEKQMNIEPITEIKVHGDMGQTNYLFIPNNRKSNFKYW